MKTPRNKGQNLYLQTKNNRWKWMAGATAATAAGVTESQANAITITLLNNYISVFDFGGNHLNADLTGDGHPDLTIANILYGYHGYTAHVTLNGVPASVRFGNLGGLYGSMRLGPRTAYYNRPRYSYTGTPGMFGTPSLMGSIPIFFKDLHINGGAPTRGSLEVTVSLNYITLDSFTYNTPVKLSGRTVPDHGSSLALLAMGAGGILALRRWRAARAQP